MQDKHNDIDMKALNIRGKIKSWKTYDLLKGRWNDSEVVVKLLKIPKSVTHGTGQGAESTALSSRHVREFAEEYAKTRIFSHQNLLPALGAVNKAEPPTLAIVAQYMPLGSLYSVLHEGRGIPVVDHAAILNFAVDIARGMKFLHDLQRQSAPKFNLNPRHIVIDEDQRARINLSDSHFSVLGNDKIYEPAWMAPEVLGPVNGKALSDVNKQAADMWSFAIVLWEMVTREQPFRDLTPMQTGMKIATETLRVLVPTGISPHMAQMIRICMKEEPAKRPKFENIVPILEKMANQ